MEGEWKTKYKCLWKSTGSAPWCSCYGNSLEYSFFSALFLSSKEKETERTSDQGEMTQGQKMRKPEKQRDKGRIKKIRNEDTGHRLIWGHDSKEMSISLSSGEQRSGCPQQHIGTNGELKAEMRAAAAASPYHLAAYITSSNLSPSSVHSSLFGPCTNLVSMYNPWLNSQLVITLIY